VKFSLASVAAAVRKYAGVLAPVSSRGGWWPIVREPYSGAWQQNVEWTTETVLAHHAVYACITLIANDIGKLRQRLVARDTNGIWSETESASFSPVLRRPNRYQNQIQFKQWWITSKLVRGNAYGLKERDARGVVVRIYVLDPARVTVLVAPDGGVYYQLGQDNMGGAAVVGASVTVPASEIIHDRMNCLFHPLVGVSPLFASGLAAHQGLEIQNDATLFFGNGSRPGGVLTAPGAISDAAAARVKAYWDDNFTGTNAGKVAVLGDGLSYQAMRMTAVDSQMIEQLKWTAEMICGTFHVPGYKVGVGPLPNQSNIEALDQQYYSVALQSLVEEYEAALDDGLGIGWGVKTEGREIGVELDLDGLWRMDTATMVRTLGEGVRGAIYTPDEARKRLNLPPIVGGDQCYLQVQNFSLAALAKRDALENPFEPATSTPPPETDPKPANPDDDGAAKALVETAAFIETLRKGLSHV
jgi:HK97 family phage portal protein